jgi:hypothetical protein
MPARRAHLLCYLGEFMRTPEVAPCTLDEPVRQRSLLLDRKFTALDALDVSQKRLLDGIRMAARLGALPLAVAPLLLGRSESHTAVTLP